MDVKVFLNRKKVLKSSVTRLKNKTAEDINQLNLSELNVRRNRFTTFGEELKDIFDNLFGLCEDEELETYSIERDEIIEILDEMLASIDTVILKNKGKNEESKVMPLKTPDSVEVKLPTLTLPSFAGSIEEWITFSDLFEAAVTKNQNLSGAQKLQYLKSALKGDALKIVQSLPITDSNFKIAWDLLSERYFHKREILCSLMKKFLNMPSLNGESHIQLLNLVDSTKEYVRLLETSDLKVEKTADTILMFIVQFKLDPATRSWWERSLKSDAVPSLDELLQFLSTHARSLMSGTQTAKRNICKKVTMLASESQVQCVFCQGRHILSKCDAFLKLSVQKRVNFVKSKNICFNCLTQFHRKSTCKSPYKCRKCKGSHHTLLHFEHVHESEPSESGKDKVSTSGLSASAKVFQPATSIGSCASNSTGGIVNNPSITCCSDFGSNAQVLLCTAVISVSDSFGGVQLCRALLDPGSQVSLITSDCLQRLALPRQRAKVLISCLGASETYTNGLSEINFTPHFTSTSSYTASVYVVNKIVGPLPHCNLDPSCSAPFSDLTLADPTFYKSGPIDILFGVNIALPLLKGQSLSFGEGKPFAVRSELGWIIAGSVPSLDVFTTIQVNNIQLVTDHLVNKFWELDSVPTVSKLTSAEKACEEHFKANYFRNKIGKYVVKLPFHSPPSKLGESKQSALRRLKSVERSLSSKPVRYKQYRDFMQEYLMLQHMEPVPETEYSKREAYYLPHHAVVRDSSTTTKLRVVFDASSKSSSGYSLNDLLMVGPRVQQDLYSILLTFRTFPIAICADVEKMFRQIQINPDDKDWQRILWRETPEAPVKEYRLTTVTYGTASAPFLSTRTLHQLALDYKDDFPLASRATLYHFYVDDLLTGAASKEEAVELVTQLNNLMKKGGFNLRKWHSNIPSIITEVPEGPEEYDVIPIQSEDEVKVLGIKWNPKLDCFSFSVAPMKEKLYTKREILSEISRIFDPLGFLSPCVVFMKILLQELWKHNLAWDQPIPEELSRRWTVFRKELVLIEKIKIPRCVLQVENTELELHAFCDASEKAFSTVIYVRCVKSTSEVYVSLLTSKTRVSPLKVQSLPRLELCAALLLANLLKVVLQYIELPIRKVLAWSDSRIALTWISSEPYRWQTFIANRVAKIQEVVPNAEWKFVRGSLNPADCATRGLLPSELLKCDMWLYGPDWLKSSENFCNEEFQISFDDEVFKEERKSVTAAVGCVDTDLLICRYSTFSKLIRVCAWILRFLHNSRPFTTKMSGCLTTSELNNAVMHIVRLIQGVEFSNERKLLNEGKPLPRDSKLLPLNVFCDSDNILRVGGRLSNNLSFSYDQKHPMLLPKNHEFTRRVIEFYHITNLHAGPQLTLSLIRQKFWFVDGRSVVRKQLKRCLKCFKLNLKPSPQLMGDLPASRITQVRPFNSIGLDFAGPFYTKCAHKRKATKFKSYICLFICTATKAIHLELVSELSTAAFLAALRRFISRRACPTKIISDNASNFKGASRHLQNLFELCRHSEVQDFTSMKGIEWSFIPPYTPHFGGLWESGIKSAKQLLIKTSTSALLNFEEFSTLLAQIEACLNSRPLTELSSDPSDLSALTPAHFLVGGPIHQFPEPSLPTMVTCLKERWSLIQRLRKFFWDRWSKEYLHRLQPRSKWWRSTPNLQVGDMVIVQRENAPPLEWTLGRIDNIFPGKDKKVRVVTITTNHGQLTRTINKVYRLPNSSDA